MKRVCKLLLSVLFVLTALFACVGCTTKDKVKCAPCTVGEIWAWNETVCEEFFPYNENPKVLASIVKCTVDGEEIEVGGFEWGTKDLSEGKHEVVFYTVEGATAPKQVKEKDGRIGFEMVEYEPKVVVNLTISEEYDDIYNREYRVANGLWIVPSYEEDKWYRECIKEWRVGESDETSWFEDVKNIWEDIFESFEEEYMR